jgi:hypothetical protein
MATKQSTVTTSVNSQELETRAMDVIKDVGFKSFLFVLVFALFTINMVAVSLALQCNRMRSLPFKLSSALFAFLFGFLYIMVNYLSYRVKMQHDPCYLHANDPFPFFNVKLEDESQK